MKINRLVLFFLFALVMWVFSPTLAAQETFDSAYLEKFFGAYELTTGRVVYIQPHTEFGGKLLYSDDTGQLRGLSPVSANEFSAGPGLLVPTPEEMKIAFAQDSEGKVIGFTLQQNGFPDRSAKRANHYNQEKVTFLNQDVTLTGILLTPLGKGPYPAVALISGSGPAERYDLIPHVHFLVRQGIAILGYDKRGVRDSTGDWRRVGLEVLADDAVAAVQFLKSRKDVDSKRIGVFGSSQGGWVGPLAASKSEDVAFVISVCGPGVSPAEQELDRVGHDLRLRGFSGDEITEALTLMRSRDNFARGTESWEDFQAAVAKTSEAKWIQYVPMPRSRDARTFEFWRRLPIDYNPTPVLEKVRVPVLALFGELDQNVLPQKNSERWMGAFQKSANEDTLIEILPRARHSLLEAQTGSDEEVPMLKRFVPEYMPLLLDWLRKHGVAP